MSPGGPRARGVSLGATFAGIRVETARHVSYYLMAVYDFPDLVDAMSPELAPSDAGRSVLQLPRVDEALTTELADVTARGAQSGV